MTAGGTSIEERSGGGDPLRRLILGALALYLAPAILIVLAVGGVGMACCAAARWLGGDRAAMRPMRDGRPRRDAAARGIAAPHLGAAAWSRSPRR